MLPPLMQKAPKNIVSRELTQFIGRINANSGTIDGSALDVVRKYIGTCISAGIWGLIYYDAPLVGNNLEAALTPLKCVGGNTLMTNLGPFVSGDYSKNTGLTGGEGKALDNGVTSQGLWNFGNSSFTMMCYYNQAGSTNQRYLGMTNTTSGLRMYTVVDDSTHDGAVGYDGSTNLYTSAITKPHCLTYTRRALNDDEIYSNGVSKGTSTTLRTVTVGTSFSFYFMAQNNNGSVTNSFTGRTAHQALGAGMTTAQILAWYNASHAMQTAFGRNN